MAATPVEESWQDDGGMALLQLPKAGVILVAKSRCRQTVAILYLYTTETVVLYSINSCCFLRWWTQVAASQCCHRHV
jgi:hypothetical protein